MCSGQSWPQPPFRQPSGSDNGRLRCSEISTGTTSGKAAMAKLFGRTFNRVRQYVEANPVNAILAVEAEQAA